MAFAVNISANAKVGLCFDFSAFCCPFNWKSLESRIRGLGVLGGGCLLQLKYVSTWNRSLKSADFTESQVCRFLLLSNLKVCELSQQPTQLACTAGQVNFPIGLTKSAIDNKKINWLLSVKKIGLWVYYRWVCSRSHFVFWVKVRRPSDYWTESRCVAFPMKMHMIRMHSTDLCRQQQLLFRSW